MFGNKLQLAVYCVHVAIHVDAVDSILDFVQVLGLEVCTITIVYRDHLLSNLIASPD